MTVLLENARIVDGTGSPWFRGWVMIEDETIVQVGRSSQTVPDVSEQIDLDGDVSGQDELALGELLDKDSVLQIDRKTGETIVLRRLTDPECFERAYGSV